MKLVIQRVKHASVTVDGNVTGKIGKGFLVLIGIANSDTKEIADQYSGIPVHLICGLPEGQSPVLYQCRCAGYGRSAVRIYDRSLPERNPGCGDRHLRC